MQDLNDLRIPLASMIGWALAPAAVVWAAGEIAWWNLYGPQAAIVPAVAFAIAAIIVIISAAAVVAKVNKARRQGGANLAYVVSQAFTMARMVNMLALVILGVLAWYVLKFDPRPFFLWLIGMYLIMLISETWWLSRRLKKPAPPRQDV